MINCIIIPQEICETVKYENSQHAQNNVTIANNCLICYQFNCKHLLIISNLDITLFNIKMPEFFLVDFEQVFYKIFFV